MSGQKGAISPELIPRTVGNSAPNITSCLREMASHSTLSSRVRTDTTACLSSLSSTMLHQSKASGPALPPPARVPRRQGLRQPTHPCSAFANEASSPTSPRKHRIHRTISGNTAGLSNAPWPGCTATRNSPTLQPNRTHHHPRPTTHQKPPLKSSFSSFGHMVRDSAGTGKEIHEFHGLACFRGTSEPGFLRNIRVDLLPLCSHAKLQTGRRSACPSASRLVGKVRRKSLLVVGVAALISSRAISISAQRSRRFDGSLPGDQRPRPTARDVVQAEIAFVSCPLSRSSETQEPVAMRSRTTARAVIGRMHLTASVSEFSAGYRAPRSVLSFVLLSLSCSATASALPSRLGGVMDVTQSIQGGVGSHLL